MTLSITTRNWLFVGAAFVVCFISASTDPARAATAPTSLLILEALGALGAASVPAFAIHRWRTTPGISYHWSLILALVAAFGIQYSAAHR